MPRSLASYAAIGTAIAVLAIGAGPWPLAAQMVVPRPAATAGPAYGARLFGQQCGACHSAIAGETRVGPSLAGVVGRKAGTVPGFAYSAPLRNSRKVWNATALDAWLAGSAQAVPGTSMTYAQADPAKRRAIIEYLATLR